MTRRAVSLLSCVALSACFAGGKREPAPKLPNAWFLGQRASAGPIPPRAIGAALDAARGEGILADGPGTWVHQGPLNVGGRLTTLGVDPNDVNHLWVGSAAGGVFESTDAGVNWTARFDAQTALSIGSLVVHPTDSNTVYVGTGEDNGGGYSFDGDGVWKTTDGGATWTNLGLAETRRIGKMAIDRNDPQRVFVAAGGNWFGRDVHRGIYRTTDGGATWSKVLYVADDTGGIDVAIDPSNSNRIYAAMWQRLSEGFSWYVGGASGGIWRSLDGGTSWSKLTTGLPATPGRIGIAIAPSQPATVYALVINANGAYANGIYRSTNGGDTWTKTSGTNVPLFFSSYSYYFGKIRVDPANANTIYCLDVNLLRSTNGGGSVLPFATSVHADWHDLRILTGGRWYAADDGGFFRSLDSGVTWFHSETLPVSQLYDASVANTDTSRRFAGLQDNYVNRTTTGGLSNWAPVIGGDGLQVEVDPTNANRVYGESQYGAIQRSTDGGSTFVDATSGINASERTNWNTPIALDPVVPTTLYTGTVRVYRSTDAAVSWSAIGPNLTNGSDLIDDLRPVGNGDWRERYLAHLEDLIRNTVTVVSVSPADNRVLWAGTDDGNVWVSTNTGANWTKVNPPGAAYWVTGIEPDPHDGDTAYLTVTGYRTGDKLPYLRVTRNLGQSWQDLSAGLPQLPLNTVHADATWRGRVFVGSDAGVHWSDDGGTTWKTLRSGMPYAVVSELFTTPSTNTLWAASFARGLFSYDLGQLPATADGDGDGVDNNADCALSDPGAFASPGEVASLAVDKGPGAAADLVWSSLAAQAGTGTVYDVARGELATLATSGTSAASALACAVAGTTVTDADLPLPDSGRYYLVRGRNACGIGSWGSGSPSVCP